MKRWEIAKNSGLNWQVVLIEDLQTDIKLVIRDDVLADKSYGDTNKHVTKLIETAVNELESDELKALVRRSFPLFASKVYVKTVTLFGSRTTATFLLAYAKTNNERLPDKVKTQLEARAQIPQNTMFNRATPNAIDLKLYSITASLTNVTSASDNAERMAAGDTKTLTFTAAEGFEFPDTVEVSGATGVWTKSTGTLVLSNATGNITFTIAAMSASGHTVTISMREQGAYATYANVYVDDGTSAVKYTADSPVTVKANSKIYIDAAADSFAVGWDGAFNATVTGGVTLTASTNSTATFAVTGDGTIVTNGITD